MDIQELIQKMCQHFGITEEQFNSKRQYFEAKNARRIVWKIMLSNGFRKYQIARMFNFDHASISYGLDSLKNDIAYYEQVRTAYASVAHLDKDPLPIPDSSHKVYWRHNLNSKKYGVFVKGQ